MSDGPLRSLNMNSRWKRVADCADNRAYSVEEVAKAFIPALDQCCKEEVPPETWRTLAAIFRNHQQTLFSDQRVDEIRALRSQVAGMPLGCLVVDLATQAASSGKVNEAALVDVTTKALIQRAARGNKAVEEHWYRKSNERRTEAVRERLEVGLKKAAVKGIALHHLNIAPAQKAPRSTKQTGLDDGVQF
jgi:hypothetical protein